MFLETLTDDQQRAFLTLARRLIAADGVFADAEYEMLQTIKSQLEVASDDVMRDAALPELLAHFESREARIKLLLGLLRLSYADDDYSPVEDDFVTTVAVHLELDGEPLEAIDRWTREHADDAEPPASLWEA
jgi:uncharacterized tellurite resistance protein B-like protein